ncbi:MAG: hypothetical protein WAV09_01445 [Minisyncoccia bacterium]
MIKKFNLSKPEKYMSNGEEKTRWSHVGTMTQFDNGGMIVEIPAIGLKASVFEQEERKNESRPAPVAKAVTEDTINFDDIPY